MRYLILLLCLPGCALFTEPKPTQFCYPIHADTLGLLARQDHAGLISECIWLTNDKPVCWPQRQTNPLTCVVGKPA